MSEKVKIILHPFESQKIYETVMDNRAKTRGSEFELEVADGHVIGIASEKAVIMEPNKIN